MLEEILESLAQARRGKFGTIRSGFDWYPGKEENDISWAKSIEIAIHPETARDLRDLSMALGHSRLPDMDVDLYVGAVPDRTLCNAVVSLAREEIGYGEARIAGDSDYEWKAPDGFQYSVRVSAEDIRIVLRDEDGYPLGVAAFAPDRLCALIDRAANGEVEREGEENAPKA